MPGGDVESVHRLEDDQRITGTQRGRRGDAGQQGLESLLHVYSHMFGALWGIPAVRSLEVSNLYRPGSLPLFYMIIF